MTKTRIPETDHGIQGEVTVRQYDEMQRNLRDRGWMETKALIASGIDHGHALEIGHGPGYLGLEWLKLTVDTHLTGLDISPDMTGLAGKNALSYGLSARVKYDTGMGDQLPYTDDTFDAVFTNGSMHEWVNPAGTFEEIYRVLKPGGRYFISDMRRDMAAPVRWFLRAGCKPKVIRPYLDSSVDAAYTSQEVKSILLTTRCKDAQVKSDPIGLSIMGVK
ncbi:MAG: class I SAM-dependent methyltransferase [Anaerolineaceae bacterium]|nr:class I SAM-dependent methyltransferase [Anaerolineaceae bacterium]